MAKDMDAIYGDLSDTAHGKMKRDITECCGLAE
jgi:hypothetical protein